MAFRWPNKDPDETLDYSVDWSRFLGDKTISSVQWFLRDQNRVMQEITAGQNLNDITITSTTNTDTVATIFISGGLNNVDYKFTCRITNNLANTVERSIKIRMREQ